MLTRQDYQEVTGTARSPATDARWATTRFCVFDAFRDGEPARPFRERLSVVAQAAAGSSVITAVEHTVCTGAAHLERKIQRIVRAGGEGVMLRKPDSAYAGYRSPTLLKAKRAYDAEARVTGHQPGKGKHVGAVGALMLRTRSGINFKAGA